MHKLNCVQLNVNHVKQGELTSASAILDFLASPEALDLPGQVGTQHISHQNQPLFLLSTWWSLCKDMTLACLNQGWAVDVKKRKN